MGGIAGFVGSGPLDNLKLMLDAQHYRGPSEKGTWTERSNNVYLGHVRHSVIDLRHGKQPMVTSDGNVVVVFSGEIYNCRELRSDLEKQGHTFRTQHSDTEVLLHGYSQWRNTLPLKLNGMWSFALYDLKRKVLLCSRDRFGQKPFFYTSNNGIFAFASESTALIKHPRVPATVSRTALKKYFAYGYIPAPHSFYNKIYKLPGGHSLLFDPANNTVKIWKYWDFVLEEFESRPADIEKIWRERLLELLSRSVCRRLLADAPTGIFLSGGVDSSAIALFAADHMRRTKNEKIHTFCTGFEETSFDESKYAARVAKYLGFEHHQDILSLDKAKDILPDILAGLDEPLGDGSLLPTYLLCRSASRYVTVALSGDGADELFAGYEILKALRWANFYQKIIPKPVHRAIRLLLGRLPVSHRYMSLSFVLKRISRGLSYAPKFWNPVWIGPLEALELSELFAEPVDIEDLYSEAIEIWDSCGQRKQLDKVSQFFTKLCFQDALLVKTDRCGVMNSLETRLPFLDIELVDFVRRIPSEYKFRNNQTKYILKESLKVVLPREILYRRKQGFAAPLGKWFRDEAFDFNKFTSTSVLNPEFTARKMSEHQRNRCEHQIFLWSQLVLSSILGQRQHPVA